MKIYQERRKDTDVFLKLVLLDGAISLSVVDEDGNLVMGGRLITLTADGHFHRATGISSTLRLGFGLKLDSKQRVEMGEDC